MFGSSIFRNKKEEIVLLIDIGSGSIGGAFVLYAGNSVPQLIYGSRIPFISGGQTVSSHPNEDDIKILVDSVLLDLLNVGFNQDYFKHADKKVHGALITFSSPWFVSKNKKIHIDHDTEFVITPKFLDSIVESEEKVFTEEINKKNRENTYSIIEKSVVHVKINGYTITDALGKVTKNLDAFLSFGAVLRTVMTSVNDSIFQKLYIPREKIFFHSFPLIAFSVLRDIYPVDANYLFMDVSGESTEISLIEDNVIVQTLSFPSGRNFILRQIAHVCNVPLEIAESTLALYNLKKTDDETSALIDGILIDIEKEWSIYLESTLLELSATMTLPTKLYITVDADVAPYYKNFLAQEKTDETGNFRKNVSVVSIDQTSLTGLYKGKINIPEDECIGLLAIFYKKMYL